MGFIFAGSWLITRNERREVLESASVCVEKDRIVRVSTRQDLEHRFPAAEIEMSAARAPTRRRIAHVYLPRVAGHFGLRKVRGWTNYFKWESTGKYRMEHAVPSYAIAATEPSAGW